MQDSDGMRILVYLDICISNSYLTDKKLSTNLFLKKVKLAWKTKKGSDHPINGLHLQV